MRKGFKTFRRCIVLSRYFLEVSRCIYTHLNEKSRSLKIVFFQNFSNLSSPSRSLFAQNNGSLFPKSLRVTDTSKRMLKPSKPNGGWGDIRDHRLCEANTYPLNVDPKLPLKAGLLQQGSDSVLPTPQMPSNISATSA